VGPVDLADKDRAHPVDLAGTRLGRQETPVDLVDLVDLAGLVARVGLDLAVTALVGPATSIRAGPAGRATSIRAGPAGRATSIRAAPAAPGTAMLSVVTSAVLRGEMGLRRGELVHRRGRAGAARFRHLGAVGSVARSTTGVTRKLRFGIPGSISGASTSSGCGSRCKKPTLTSPVWPPARRASCFSSWQQFIGHHRGLGVPKVPLGSTTASS
jgi:hypothetical protein